MTSFMTRLKRSFRVLTDRETEEIPQEFLMSASNPTTFNNSWNFTTTRAVLSPIQTRISIDVSSLPFRHVIIDENEQFVDYKSSELNDRLRIQANIDQTGTDLIRDAVATMLEHGACALVPIETSINPNQDGFEILSMRVGTVLEWFNQTVRVQVYNELNGQRVERILPKSFVAICYNPLYSIMNEANSTLKRLTEKLALLDIADGYLYSPRLDLILQLPYSIKTERQQTEAARRVEAMESQLYNGRYGIAYAGAVEKITQLNRPVTNTLGETVESLTTSLYNQLGLTPSVFSGTASPDEMVSYNNRTVLPIARSLCESMRSAFFSRTAIRQGNSIIAFPNLFKMAPLETFAEAADKLTRNEIMTSNEVRAVVGLKPSSEPDADKLRNKNLNKTDNPEGTVTSADGSSLEKEEKGDDNA